ncbi:hypothetical protein EMIT079MI2_370018 [Bacillus sp. IT-79MI2]|uniref:hypothetical protein n=1 Tax=Bacillus sp. IT-79MI2 TaxID=3026438 RepID=UPI0039E0CCF7
MHVKGSGFIFVFILILILLVLGYLMLFNKFFTSIKELQYSVFRMPVTESGRKTEIAVEKLNGKRFDFLKPEYYEGNKLTVILISYGECVYCFEFFDFLLNLIKNNKYLNFINIEANLEISNMLHQRESHMDLIFNKITVPLDWMNNLHITSFPTYVVLDSSGTVVHASVVHLAVEKYLQNIK